MTIHPEIKSDGHGGWVLLSRSTQIWELISKSIQKRLNFRWAWAEFYQIDTSNFNEKNRQKVHDIREFLEKLEYAYHKRRERLLEELNENKEERIYGTK